MEWGLEKKIFYLNVFTKFPPYSALEIDPPTWEYVLCIFHSSQEEFSVLRREQDWVGRVGWVPPAVSSGSPIGVHRSGSAFLGQPEGDAYEEYVLNQQKINTASKTSI